MENENILIQIIVSTVADLVDAVDATERIEKQKMNVQKDKRLVSTTIQRTTRFDPAGSSTTKSTKTKEENTNNNMQVVNESDTESEDDNEVPEVVYIYDNKDTNRSYMHRPTRAGEVGFTGLKHDINIFLKIIIEGLKNALEGEEKSLTKDTQNILKKMVETSESVTDLRNVILEIENTVYTLASDKKEVPEFHPSTDVFVNDTHCFGCHSRSSRISTNFMGLQETL